VRKRAQPSHYTPEQGARRTAERDSVRTEASHARPVGGEGRCAGDHFVFVALGGVFLGPDGIALRSVLEARSPRLEDAHPSRGFAVGLPVTCPVWGSNPGPPESERRSLTTEP